MKDTAHNFPIKLHTLLDSEDPDIVCWTITGNGFRVNDTDRFRDEALPKYWRHTKMTSFQRQLNLYGFKKINHGDDMGAYYHPLFVRGKRELLKDIKRSAIKSSAMEAELNCINRIVDRNRQEVVDCSNDDECLPRKRAAECDNAREDRDAVPESKRPIYAQADSYYSMCTPPAFKPMNNWDRNCPDFACPPFTVKAEPGGPEPGTNIYVKCEPGESNIVSYNPITRVDPSLMTYPTGGTGGESKFDFDYFFENLVHLNTCILPSHPTLSQDEVEFIPSSTDIISDEEFMLLMEC